MYCSKCGKRIPDDANFCNFCGARVEIIVEDPKLNNQVENNSVDTESLAKGNTPSAISDTIDETSTVENNSLVESSEFEPSPVEQDLASDEYASVNNTDKKTDIQEPSKDEQTENTSEKTNKEEKKSSHFWIYSLLVFGLIFAGFKTCQYQQQKRNNEGVMRYVEREYGSLDNVVAGKHEGSRPMNSIDQSNSSYSQEAEFRKLTHIAGGSSPKC